MTTEVKISREARNRLAVLFGLLFLIGGTVVLFLTWNSQRIMTARQTKMETLARDLEERTEALAAMGHFRYPVAVIDEQGDVVVWNDAVVELTGWTSKEVIKEGALNKLMNSEQWGKHCAGFRKAMDKRMVGTLTIVPCTIRHKRGTDIPVRIAVRMLESRSGHLYAVANIDPESKIERFDHSGKILIDRS